MYMRDFKGWDALTLEKSGGPGQCLRTASGPVRRHDKYGLDLYQVKQARLGLNARKPSHKYAHWWLSRYTLAVKRF